MALIMSVCSDPSQQRVCRRILDIIEMHVEDTATFIQKLTVSAHHIHVLAGRGAGHVKIAVAGGHGKVVIRDAGLIKDLCLFFHPLDFVV